MPYLKREGKKSSFTWNSDLTRNPVFFLCLFTKSVNPTRSFLIDPFPHTTNPDKT